MWKIKRIILSVLYICFASAAVVFSLFFLFTRFLLTEPPEQPDEFSPITTVTIPSEENKSDDTSEEIPHIVFDETKADEDLPVSSSAHSPMIALTSMTDRTQTPPVFSTVLKNTAANAPFSQSAT